MPSALAASRGLKPNETSLLSFWFCLIRRPSHFLLGFAILRELGSLPESIRRFLPLANARFGLT